MAQLTASNTLNYQVEIQANSHTILADEPTGALDTANAGMVTDLLLTLNADHGVTVLIVTHDHRLAARCSRQVSLSDGELTQDGVVTEDSLPEASKV